MSSNNLREVHITVSAIQTGEIYYCKSYPDIDFNNNGKMEAYKTPVYRVYIDGRDGYGTAVRKEWKALRFMPYWNDPKAPFKQYKNKGWINSGKTFVARKTVTYFDPNYGVHNTYSPYNGAIGIDKGFLIHAGPEQLTDYGWGSAGCVEIIGSFDEFKNDIRDLSGSSNPDASEAITEMVKQGKLSLQLDYAKPPDFKKNFIRELE